MEQWHKYVGNICFIVCLRNWVCILTSLIIFFFLSAQLDIINLLRLGHTSANQFECFFHVLTWLCD